MGRSMASILIDLVAENTRRHSFLAAASGHGNDSAQAVNTTSHELVASISAASGWRRPSSRKPAMRSRPPKQRPSPPTNRSQARSRPKPPAILVNMPCVSRVFRTGLSPFKRLIVRLKRASYRGAGARCQSGSGHVWMGFGQLCRELGRPTLRRRHVSFDFAMHYSSGKERLDRSSRSSCLREAANRSGSRCVWPDGRSGSSKQDR